MSSTTDPSATDQVIAGRYALRSRLGRGAMGTVWLAEDSLLTRAVAIKEIDIPPGFDQDERDALEARLLREARAAARLSHAGVVSVYDVVEHGERPWIVMEYVEAPTLDEIVKEKGALAPEETARIGIELCNILEAAHAEGIVHRDVKPANVMCTEAGHVKLADFGIASVQDDPKITQTGLVLGSPSFMAPEQASKGVSGPEADLWSLGATLYQTVEGEAPFDRGSALPTLTAVMTDDPRPMQRAGSLAPVISALLRKEPGERPTLAETRTMLENIADPSGAPVAPVADVPPATTRVVLTDPKPTVVASPGRHEDRNWWPWVALVAGFAALIAIPLLLRGPDDPSAGDGRRERANQGSTANEDAESDSGSDAGDASEGEVPEDWATYTDPGSGYTIGYPSEWAIVPRTENTLDFTDPSSGTYLRVAWTDAPGDDVMARLEEIEDTFAAEHDDYERLQMTPTGYQGHEAGLWEYTYEEGAALHAYNLQFVVAQTYGFALNFQTHEDDWAGSQELWDTFQATFEAPSA